MDAPRWPPVADLARRQGGVVSRRQLYRLGLTRGQVRAQVRARRWRRVHSQSIAVHTGPLEPEGEWWAAVLEAGPRAQLDGASALVAGGLRHFDVRRIRVSVPRGVKPHRARGLDIRQTRRWDLDDLVEIGVPRTRPAVAAVRGALWAGTDRQAALLLTMTVQQRLASADDIGRELLRIRRDRRRALLQSVVLDLLGGAESLGELDVARECRRRGLPEPTRQQVRRTPRGSWHLDVLWEAYAVVLEVDGIQHAWADHVVRDALRHNDIALCGDTVLRLPLLGLRVAPDEFFDQVRRALVGAGWVQGRSA